MSLNAFEARQHEAQQIATVHSLDVTPAHAAVQHCIDSAPELGPSPELTWLD